jgi:hypothetical protein
MDRQSLRDVFPESTTKKWNWIDRALVHLATSIGLSAKWQSNHAGWNSHDEITDSVCELERHLKDLFAEEAKWWCEVIPTPTFRERYETSLNRIAEKRKKLLRGVNELVETSKFVAFGSEWEELAASVESLRDNLAEYRLLEVEVARSLTAATETPGQKPGPSLDAPQRRPRPR